MRRILSIALLTTACSHAEVAHAPLAGATNGPDAVLLQIPSNGGTAHAYRWLRDTVLWSSTTRLPAVERTLAFDDTQGSLAYVDSRGIPGRLDLHVGNASAAATTVLTSLTSSDGWAIYGITPKHEVSRLTPSGTWTFRPETEPRGLLPLNDGSLVLLSDAGNRHSLRRLHPPEPRITEATSVPHSELMVRTDLGDRLYFIGDSGMAGVRTRDFTRTKTIWLPGTAVDAVATPSGDRIFVAVKGKKSIAIVDRFTEQVSGSIDIDGPVSALRMDPDGRYLLAKCANADSVRIIAIGTARAIGTVRTQWRADLPLVGPDAGIALLQDNDVSIIDAETHREKARFLSGAADLWMLIRWNGFRPRAAGLDQPVRFENDDDSTEVSAAAEDSIRALRQAAATANVPLTPRPLDPAPRPIETPQKIIVGAPKHGTFTLSFAALLSEDRAKTLAASILIDGHAARVVPGTSDKTPIYRVIYGPFDTKEDADRAGKRTGLPYWVYEGAP